MHRLGIGLPVPAGTSCGVDWNLEMLALWTSTFLWTPIMINSYQILHSCLRFGCFGPKGPLVFGVCFYSIWASQNWSCITMFGNAAHPGHLVYWCSVLVFLQYHVASNWMLTIIMITVMDSFGVLDIFWSGWSKIFGLSWPCHGSWRTATWQDKVREVPSVGQHAEACAHVAALKCNENRTSSYMGVVNQLLSGMHWILGSATRLRVSSFVAPRQQRCVTPPGLKKSACCPAFFGQHIIHLYPFVATLS